MPRYCGYRRNPAGDYGSDCQLLSGTCYVTPTTAIGAPQIGPHPWKSIAHKILCEPRLVRPRVSLRRGDEGLKKTEERIHLGPGGSLCLHEDTVTQPVN